MSDVTIRQAVESDVDEIFRLITEFGYPDLNHDEFAAVFPRVLNHAEMTLLLAQDGEGRIVGLASISHRPQLRLAGIVVTLDEMAVANEARGKGVGRALLNRVKLIARELGARRVELQTNRARESYQRGFYVKNGFSEANSAVMRLTQESSEPRK